MYGLQLFTPHIGVGFAEEMCIASLTLSSLASLLLLRRRRPALAVALLSVAVFFSLSVRAGRVVDPAMFRAVGKGKVAVVTGANQGIGKAAVQLLCEAGFEVVLCSRDPELGEVVRWM